jgi:hypothetical protein
VDTAILIEGCEMKAVVSLATKPRVMRAIPCPTLQKGDPVMAASVNESVVTLVTASGALVQLSVKGLPFTVLNTKQLSGKFARMDVSFLGTLMLDDRGGGLFVSTQGEWLPLPCHVKNAVMCTRISFLARVRGGKHALRAFQFVGQFTPLETLVASKCPALTTRETRNTAIASAARTCATCLSWGMPLAMLVIQAREAPRWAYEQALLLRQLCSTDPRLTAPAARYSYVIRDYQFARELFLSRNPEDPREFVANILKAVTIQVGGGDGFKQEASLLLVRGLVYEAIDLLLMAGNWQAAASNLITLGMLSEAALVLRAQEQSPERTALILKLAERMLVVEMTAYGMILLSEIEDFDQIAMKFRDMGETGQSIFLARLAWE